MPSRPLHRIIFVLALLAATAQSTPPSSAQVPTQAPVQAEELTTTIHALDAKLFDAYNHCDLATLGSMVSDDLEFYDDRHGLSIGKATFLANYQKYICGKVRRDLVEASFEAHPLQGFGAVEMGAHRFHQRAHPEEVGEARFVLLWQNQNSQWKMTRVISYEHAAAK